MRALLLAFTITACLSVGLQVNAQNPNTGTATCKDGTSVSAATRRGACRGHGGVKAFSSAAVTAPPSSSPAAASPSSVPTLAQKIQTPASQPTVTGRAGQVWVNAKSKVYHCQGDRYYGNTKAGSYMTEAAAKAQGDRPDHGKACS